MFSPELKDAPLSPLVLCSLTIVIVLLTSGIAKAKDPASTAAAIVNLKINRWVPMKAASKLVPPGEIALGLWILFAPGPLALLGGSAAVLLFSFYWLVIARAVATGNTASCNCFGGGSTAPISGYTLGRNSALLAAAVGTLAATTTGTSTLQLLLTLDMTGWLWLLGATLVAVSLWCLYRAELVPTSAPDSANVPRTSESEPATNSAETDDDDYIRLPIPYGTLRSLHTGSVSSLRELAEQQARVLIWVSPGCAPCRTVLEQVEGWQKKLPMLGIHPVISTESQRELLGLGPQIEVLVDDNYSTEPVFGRGTPLVVALGTDGLVAGGPVAGRDGVIQFMNDLMTEFDLA